MKNQTLVILDFGGHTTQLLARRVRDMGVYSVVRGYKTSLEELKNGGYRGVILSGGVRSVLEDGAPGVLPGILSLGVPVLGIGYGAFLMARLAGGSVTSGPPRDGTAPVRLEECPLLRGIAGDQTAVVRGSDLITALPDGFAVNGSYDGGIAVFGNPDAGLYGTVFLPETDATPCGGALLHNFLYDICGFSGDWSVEGFIDDAVAAVKAQIGDRRVVCGLSGGVDSAVSAVLVSKAVGKQLTCILVDHGLMRKNEAALVESLFRQTFDIDLIHVDAEARFLDRLAGVADPEQKRKIIGEEFIRVFEEESGKLGTVDFLVQGTIYPDIIESGSDQNAVVKSHHNVGGLPERMNLSLCEPLKDLFKDEVRRVGLALGMPGEMVWRQPFPGPGLGVRCIGAITKARLDILREADAIFREEMAAAGLDRSVNQFFAIITDMRSVGVTNNQRTYDYTIALRAVQTTDFMTAAWANLPHELLDVVSARIVKEVPNVNRIVYDITSKPPATIEWE